MSERAFSPTPEEIKPPEHPTAEGFRIASWLTTIDVMQELAYTLQPLNNEKRLNENSQSVRALCLRFKDKEFTKVLEQLDEGPFLHYSLFSTGKYIGFIEEKTDKPKFEFRASLEYCSNQEQANNLQLRHRIDRLESYRYELAAFQADEARRQIEALEYQTKLPQLLNNVYANVNYYIADYYRSDNS